MSLSAFSGGEFGGRWVAHGGGLAALSHLHKTYPLVNIQIAIENGDL